MAEIIFITVVLVAILILFIGSRFADSKPEDRVLKKELKQTIKKAKKTHELYSRRNKGM